MITAEEACHLTEAARLFKEEEFQEILEDLSRSIRCYASQGKKSIVHQAKQMYVDKMQERLNIPGNTAIFTVEKVGQWSTDANSLTDVRISWFRV